MPFFPMRTITKRYFFSVSLFRADFKGNCQDFPPEVSVCVDTLSLLADKRLSRSSSAKSIE